MAGQGYCSKICTLHQLYLHSSGPQPWFLVPNTARWRIVPPAVICVWSQIRKKLQLCTANAWNASAVEEIMIQGQKCDSPTEFGDWIGLLSLQDLNFTPRGHFNNYFNCYSLECYTTSIHLVVDHSSERTNCTFYPHSNSPSKWQPCTSNSSQDGKLIFSHSSLPHVLLTQVAKMSLSSQM